MDEREKNLPKWAQDLINELRFRNKAATEPLIAEVAQQRPRIELLERRQGAIEELLTCAAKGGHKTAAEIIAVLESYGLTVTKE